MATATQIHANANVAALLDRLDGVRESGENRWEARCPGHDDRNPSLSIAVADDGRILLHCHAGCKPADLLAEVGMKTDDLFPSGRASRSSRPGANGKQARRRIVGTYDYRDADGKVISQAVRYEPKDFCQRRPDGKGGWRWNMKGVELVPYRLPELLQADPEEIVLVVEGEKDVDRLWREGLVATCNAMGAGCWKASHAKHLAGRHVVVIPDNDQAGRDHAEGVAESLIGIAASTKVVELPGLPDKGDVSNYLDDGGTIKGLLDAAETAPEWTPSEAPADESDEEDKADLDQQLCTADKLVRLALGRYRIGRTDSDEAFAVEVNGPNLAIMLRGSRDALRSILSRAFRQEYGKVPNSAALTSALTSLQGEAYEAEPEAVHLSVAEHEGRIILDLGDASGRAVVIGPDGWEVVERSPVLFRRTATSGALPVPESGGELSELSALLNVTEDTWPLVRGWLLASLIPNIQHPILLFGGQKGTGKSTVGELLIGPIGLIDPSPAMRRSQPRNEENWAVMAAGSWAVLIDNVSSIPQWWSDALCRAVTGDGWVSRRRYSDTDLSVLSFRRVVVLTSIDPGALKDDLGDRVLLVDQDPIEESSRRTEQEIKDRFEAARPRILGALLDLLSKVLAERPRVKLVRLPRMADFAVVLAAIDRVLPADPAENQTLALYLGQRLRIAENVIEGDEVALAIEALMSRIERWEGTATELLVEIKPKKLPQGWPKTAPELGARLTHLIQVFKQVGILIKRDRTGHKRKRLITIEKLDMTGKSLSASSAAARTAGHAEESGDSPRTAAADDGLPYASGCPQACPPEFTSFPEENGHADRADKADSEMQLVSSGRLKADL